ncbi:FxsA family protein [Ochrobactrum quorumnocens]|uniref:Membrane protein FxsA n=2 Tax=Ochrobactrum quorumnocens TaxID=271865 RepID=A0A5N1JYW9_9HYPH|nr:FxsA family protein [[Ochrobactrum] quorumnocens]KAA9369297.1 membrane protein FxsA [[Ochrobactrum] quorumnocens]MBD7991200.1 membrane protein FxsA [Ochrobactrum gallinarum]
MSSSLAPLAILAMPFIEIAGFVIVGSEIGVFATLGLIILSAMLGFFLLRVQGFGLLQRIRAESAAGRVPDREMMHGAMIVVAAIMLIVPGFVTSAIGLLLFVPFIRNLVWNRFVRNRLVVATASTRYSEAYRPYEPRENSYEPKENNVIDLDPEDYTAKPDENSPWNPDRKDR